MLQQSTRPIDAERSPFAQIVLAILVFAAVLDAFDLWGRVYAPERLSHTVCALLPLTKPIWPLTYNRVIASSYSSCSTIIGEPTASNILFLFKMTIGIVAIVPYWIWTAISPEQFRLARNQVYKNLSKPNGFRDQIQLISASTIAMTTIILWAFRTIIGGEAGLYMQGIQKPVEDGCAGIAFFILIMITQFPLIAVRYWLETRSGRNSDNG